MSSAEDACCSKPEIDKINEKYPKKETSLRKQQETHGFVQKNGGKDDGRVLAHVFPDAHLVLPWFRFFPGL